MDGEGHDPDDGATTALNKEETSRLKDVSPVLDFLKMRTGKEKMFDIFLDLVQQELVFDEV